MIRLINMQIHRWLIGQVRKELFYLIVELNLKRYTCSRENQQFSSAISNYSRTPLWGRKPASGRRNIGAHSKETAILPMLVEVHGRKILSNPFEFRETALIGGVWQVRVETFRALFAVLVAIPRPENDAFNDRHRRYRDDPLTRAMQFSRNGDGFSTPIDAHHFLPSSIIFNPDYNPLFWITRFLTLQNFEKKKLLLMRKRIKLVSRYQRAP